jgi:hypothetical protein
VGSLGFEPRLPTPQAGILDQARLRPHSTTSTPTLQSPNIKQEIIKTIVKCTAAGLSNGSIRSIFYTLKQLSKAVDLMKPEEVKTHISTMQTVKEPHRPLNNATKQKLINNYEYFVQTHGLTWKRPFYKTQEVIPIIHKTESVTKIISAATERNATIFTILAETGLEITELSSMIRSQIDTEQE